MTEGYLTTVSHGSTLTKVTNVKTCV